MSEIKANDADKTPHGHHRSPHWHRERKAHLDLFPNCAVCGRHENLEVHHIRPFHLHPELELEPSNLITLCENKKDGVNCHLLFGHLGNYRSFNASVREDARLWREKLSARPKTEAK